MMIQLGRQFGANVVVAALIVIGAALTAPLAIAQVAQVEDINPGPGGTYTFRAGPLGIAIYFNAYDGTHGEELWVSDGTAEGTYLVADIWPNSTYDESGAYSSNPQQFLAATGGMYFMAAHREEPLDPPIHDIRLWLSNGEPGNASIVPGFELALVDSLANAVVMGGDLLIAGWDETYGIELWKVVGSTATRLTDIEPGVGGSFPNQLTVVGDQLFFQATNSATSGIELWVTDGTAGGEVLIDIIEGTGSSYPTDLVSFDGKVFFQGYTIDEGAELWASDGSEGGTAMVADIAPGYNVSSSPMNLVPVGDQLFFTASEDGGYGYDLWVYDGAEARKVKAEGTPAMFESIAFDGRLFFVANDPVAGKELWVSDGSDVGTHLVTDIYPGTSTVGEDTFANSSEPAELTVAGNFLFFNADDGVHGPSLWVTDGTSAGTFMVANLFDHPTEEGPKGLTATTDRLFFQTESDLGREVHSLLTTNVVKPPAPPTGEESGSTETAYTYSSTGGSVSLDGGMIQYRFDWGDGDSTGWLEVGVTSAEHTWTVAGTYEVTIQARSVDSPSIISNSSDALSVLMSFTEAVDVSMPSAPDTGQIWVEYEFSISGGSDYGHDVEFRVDWGDGEATAWAAFDSGTGEALSHDWNDLGDWPVTVTLRCADHTEVSNSVEHWISIEEETLDTPTVDGPTTGWLDTEYSFTIGGGSSAGHDLEYYVDWGDGNTGWQPFGAGQKSVSVSHTWSVAETFPFEVGVRCAAHDSLESWYYDHSIDITEPPEEELTGPDLQGSWNGYPDVSYAFTLSASSNLGHDLEYQVDWGDGEGIVWTPFGEGLTTVEISHIWDAVSTYDMYIEIRCIGHTDTTSSGLWQMFIDPEVVSEISLIGPSSGAAGVSYDSTLTGRSSSAHDMQYYMDWGHPGAQTGWQNIDPVTGTVDLSHVWPADRTYHLQFGVRCTDHPEVEEWSETWVEILGETITTHTLGGPSEGLVGVDLEFTVTGTSSEGHALEYRFDWGDGFPTDWAPLASGTATEAYHWAYPDEFTVTASVRCTTHHHVLGERQQLVTVTFEAPPGWLFGDGFESGDTAAW